MKKISILLALVAVLGGTATAQTYYVLDAPDEGSINTIWHSDPYVLSGPGDTVYFEAKKTWLGAQGLFTQYSQIASEEDDDWTDSPDGCVSGSLSTSYQSFWKSISTDAKYIRFATKVGATLWKYWKNVKVKMANPFLKEPSKMTLNFDTVQVGASKVLQFTIDYNRVTDMTFSSDNGVFTVNNSDVHTGWDLTKTVFAGTQTATVTFTPTKEGIVSGTITISCALGSKTVTVQGEGYVPAKPDPDPDPNPDPTPTGKLTPTIVAPTAFDTITYGPTLANIELTQYTAKGANDTTLLGSWTWEVPTTTPNAGFDQTFPAVFTPTDTTNYNSVSFQATLHVRKASQTLYWDQDLSNLHLGDTIELTGTSGASLPIYYTSEIDSMAHISGTKLIALGVDSISGIAITIHGDGNQNYEAAPGITLYAYITTSPASSLQETNDSKHATTKFLQGGSLYIRRNNHVYNAKGQLVK